MNSYTMEKFFNATAAHPVLERVRITENPEHVALIRLPEVAGVILRRGENPKVQEALAQLSAAHGGVLDKDLHPASWEEDASGKLRFRDVKWAKLVPNAVVEDMTWLRQQFRYAAWGKSPWQSDLRNETVLRPKKETYAPHIDGDKGGEVDVRMITSYTLSKKLTTELYPGVCGQERGRELYARYKSEGEPLKDGLGRQRLEIGDALFIKGFFPNNSTTPRDVRECLLHSKPWNDQGGLRLAYVLSI
jgi:hypothetical protein